MDHTDGQGLARDGIHHPPTGIQRLDHEVRVVEGLRLGPVTLGAVLLLGQHGHEGVEGVLVADLDVWGATAERE